MFYKDPTNKILTLEEFKELQRSQAGKNQPSSRNKTRTERLSKSETTIPNRDNRVELAKKTLSPARWKRDKPYTDPIPMDVDLLSSWRLVYWPPEHIPLESEPGPLFGMSIESVVLHRTTPMWTSKPYEAVTIKTTGAHYILSEEFMSLRCRINPRTNEYYFREERPEDQSDREVATLDFDTHFQWFDIVECNRRYCVIHGHISEDEFVRFEFNSDSLFFMTYNGDHSFGYVHKNEIPETEWQKEWSMHVCAEDPRPGSPGEEGYETTILSFDSERPFDPHPEALLHRMWTDGHGGTLHAYICGKVELGDDVTSDQTHIFLGVPEERRSDRILPDYPSPIPGESTDGTRERYLNYFYNLRLYHFDLDENLYENDDHYPQMAHMVFPPRFFDQRRFYRDAPSLFIWQPNFSGMPPSGVYPETLVQMIINYRSVESEIDAGRTPPGFVYVFNQVYLRSPWDPRAPQRSNTEASRMGISNCPIPRVININRASERDRFVLGYDFDPFDTPIDDRRFSQIRRNISPTIRNIEYDLDIILKAGDRRLEFQELIRSIIDLTKIQETAGRRRGPHVLGYFSGVISPDDYRKTFLRDLSTTDPNHRNRGYYYETVIGHGTRVRRWRYIDHKAYTLEYRERSDDIARKREEIRDATTEVEREERQRELIAILDNIDNASWREWDETRPEGFWNRLTFFQQSVQDTIDALKYLVDNYHYEGFYLDTASLGYIFQNNWYRTYKLFRGLRDQVKTSDGEDLILYHHNTNDPWGCHSGLRSIMIDCYSDFTLTGETHSNRYFINPDNAGFENPDEDFMRYYVSGYGLSQAIGGYTQRTNKRVAASWQDAVTTAVRSLRGVSETNMLDRDTVVEQTDIGRANFSEDPDVQWPPHAPPGSPRRGFYRETEVTETSMEDPRSHTVEITLTWPKRGTQEAVLTYTRCDDPRCPGEEILPAGQGPLQVWWAPPEDAINSGPDGVQYHSHEDDSDEWVFTLRGRRIREPLPNEFVIYPGTDNEEIINTANVLNSERLLRAVVNYLGLAREHENELYRSHLVPSEFPMPDEPDPPPEDDPENLLQDCTNGTNLLVENIPEPDSGEYQEWVIRYREGYSRGIRDEWRVDVRQDIVVPVLFTIIKHGNDISVYQGLVHYDWPRIYKYRIRSSDGESPSPNQVWGTVDVFDFYRS